MRSETLPDEFVKLMPDYIQDVIRPKKTVLRERAWSTYHWHDDKQEWLLAKTYHDGFVIRQIVKLYQEAKVPLVLFVAVGHRGRFITVS